MTQTEEDIAKILGAIVLVILLAIVGFKVHARFIRWQCEQVIEDTVSKSAMKCFNEGC